VIAFGASLASDEKATWGNLQTPSYEDRGYRAHGESGRGHLDRGARTLGSAVAQGTQGY